jgi:drug/metabolite transporter (DMT)-like permease
LKSFHPTLLALLAILLWGTLALAGNGLQAVPRMFLLGITLSTSGLLSLVFREGWRIPFKVFLVGVGGIFGYHFLYFTAFAHAPAIETNLLNYLWPLLIVILTPVLLPGTGLRSHHIVGAICGLAGAALIASGGKLSFEVRYLAGYSAALGAAFIWAVYSLLTKRLPPFPTSSIGAFCLLSGILSLGIYFLDGGTVFALKDIQPVQWIFLVLVGIGPMGAAFFLWDAALKKGDSRTIGSLAYITPLLSTMNLIIFAGQRLTALTFLAMLLIIAGAAIGSWRGNAKGRLVEVDPSQLNA